MTADKQPYVPLLQRHGLRDTHVLERWTVPPKLEYLVLSQWCRDVISANLHLLYDWDSDSEIGFIQDPGIAIARALNIEMPISYGLKVDRSGDVHVVDSPTARIMSAAEKDHDLVLDIIDYLLSSDLADASSIDELRVHLRDGNAAWSVSKDSGSLIMLQSQEEASNFERILSAASESADPFLVSASQHLRDAHSYAWTRRTMNAPAAYQSAVMAIESALRELVMPGQSHARLSHIITQLRLPKHQWRARLGGKDTVTQLAGVLELLAGEQDKHGQVMYEVNDIAEAQDAVTLAIAIVGLSTRGFLTRDGDSNVSNC